MKQAGTESSKASLDDIKSDILHAVIYLGGLIQAGRAVKASRSLPNEPEHRIKCLQEAADFYLEDMANSLDLAFEEICDKAGIDYRAARFGDVAMDGAMHADKGPHS